MTSARPNKRHTVYGTPLPKKLGIKEGHRVAVLGAPAAFGLELPEGATMRTRATGPVDVIVSFHTERADLVARLPQLRAIMEPGAGLWIAWPKKASKVPTDITEDGIREIMGSQLVDNKVCAIDETWSGLRLVIRREHR